MFTYFNSTSKSNQYPFRQVIAACFLLTALREGVIIAITSDILSYGNRGIEPKKLEVIK